MAARIRSRSELPDLRERLESIVLPGRRPALLVQDDDFADPPAPWTWLAQHRDVLQSAVRATGRIEIQLPSGVVRRASGFLIAENLFMTNRHVSELFISGLSPQALAFLPGCSARVDFKGEYARADQQLCAVVAPVLVHPLWDLALLRITGAEALAPLTLADSAPEPLPARCIATIGYPAVEPTLATLQQQIAVFDGIFDRKRLQPGTIMGTETIDYQQQKIRALVHDCSTLGGNSGSAVVDVASGVVLGLHFAGQHLTANYAVPLWELASDPAVRQLGVRFQALPRTPPGLRCMTP